MNAVAIIRADLTRSPIGTSSRLTAQLCGTPVLTRTIQRAASAKKVQSIIVSCPPDQVETVTPLVAHDKVRVCGASEPPLPLSGLIVPARKWALASWRGGVAGSCFFDEHIHPRLCLNLASECKADMVVCAAAEGPWLDPQLIDDMLEYCANSHEPLSIVFAQAPPGLAPTLVGLDLLAELAQKNLSPGWINTYRPDKPRKDLTRNPMCFRPPLEIINAGGRLTSDTQRGLALLEQLTPQLTPQACAQDICRVLSAIRRTQADPFPREIQIELTTRDQLAESLLRPRGPSVGVRGPMDVRLFNKAVTEIATHDDALIVLGGFGDPLLHPEFTKILTCCREAAVFGLAVRTNAIALSNDMCQALIDASVDIVEILLDSTQRKHYQQVHGCDQYDGVIENIGRLQEHRNKSKRPVPFVVPTLIKAQETFDHLDSFFDHWVRTCGWAVIEGYSHHALQQPDRRVMNMAPPVRQPCRQLRDRLTILADGTVTACDQDYAALRPVGNLQDQSIQEIWDGATLTTLRRAHQQQTLDADPLCAKCDAWHNP